MLNDFFVWLGVDAWRPALTALLLPPVPFLLLVLVGARLMFRRRLLAWSLILVAVLGIWFSCTAIASQLLSRWLLPPVRALSAGEVGDLKRAPKTAIVVLGGGRKLLAPEYGVSDLSPRSLDRLRYGLWLGRETQLPVMFSGGVGHGADGGPTEAEIAARVAERDFGRPLKWTETASRDTRENALRSVALLQQQGIERIVVVTSAFHMPRSMRNFERAVAAGAGPGKPSIALVAAPMDVDVWERPGLLHFLPSRGGYQEVSVILHEWLGRVIGA